MKRARVLLPAIFLVACAEEQSSAVSYNTASIERASISVSVGSTGVVEPLAVIEVKSKASGEVLELLVGEVDADGKPHGHGTYTCWDDQQTLWLMVPVLFYLYTVYKQCIYPV